MRAIVSLVWMMMGLGVGVGRAEESSFRRPPSNLLSRTSFRRKSPDILGRPNHSSSRGADPFQRRQTDRLRPKFSRHQAKYRLKVENTRVSDCPGGWESEVGPVKGNMTGGKLFARHGGHLQSLRLSRDGGLVESILLPSCFDMEATFTFQRRIREPFISAYLNVGGKPLCEKFENNAYCAPSRHAALSGIKPRPECRFCDVCAGASVVRKELRKMGSIVRGPREDCPKFGAAIKAGEAYPFLLRDVCTPSVEEMEEGLEGELGRDWRRLTSFARRGNIQIQLHIFERENPAPRPCLHLGAGIYRYKGPRSQARIMERNLRLMCHSYRSDNPQSPPPKDIFLGCAQISVNYILEDLSK